jgi:mono/diheme cytochrome c family protein
METRRIVSFFLGSLAALAMSCAEDIYIKPPVERDAGNSTAVAPDAAGAKPADDGVACLAIQAQPGPAREKITGGTLPPAAGESTAMFAVADLFNAFQSQCATCHAIKDFTPLTVASQVDFVNRVDSKSIERMTTEDPKLVMPMGKTLLKDRPPTDPIVQLKARLAVWLEQGKPDSFPDPLATSDGPASSSSFLLSPTLSQSLTNMGSCVPAARIVGSESGAMDELDALFAGLTDVTELPTKLSQTDLNSLDSEALAKHGVYSYAPTYTLWSDDAHKMRYVRVPRGQSIAFDADKQSFSVPDNTRFYKTFLKEVRDLNGNVGYQKIETRLIVVRRAVDSGQGLPDIKALFGTYRWNADETEADLITEPLNNGRPFPDTKLLYVQDEKLEQEVRNDPKFPKLSAVGQENLLLEKGAVRHYAIPGSKRCVDCHMGGEDGAFVLGFSPLQIRRRAIGEGGVVEPAGPDELNQLERFIDYGLITGLSKGEIARKVLPLESSQGKRLPRNDYELIAQGYMLGNCAHCHNPNGFPTRTAPVLRDVLDFAPSANGGGIFQFPLDRVSPRIRRSADIPAPYVTPSLSEQPVLNGRAPGVLVADDSVAVPAAPWRSLIYRNVDSTFTYSDGSTIFPHMPMHTAGYDCRAPRIMAEWMLSIPSRRQVCLPEQQANRDLTTASFCTANVNLITSPDGDAPQPFVEVKPGEAAYDKAKLEASARLVTYRSGERYNGCNQCPDTFDAYADSTDSDVNSQSVLNASIFTPVRVPTNRCHWVVTDLTVRPGPWAPRNGSWSDVLVKKNVSSFPADARKTQTSLVGVLQKMRLDDELKKLATTEVPFGYWKDKPGCTFPGIQTAKQLPPKSGWAWFESGPNNRDRNPEGHVYMQSPGSAIFNMTCVNCHGPNLDASGRQADTVAQLSGGRTTVANWRDGLLGPVGMAGQARESVFSAAPSNLGSVDDWAARYMSWMALGGTQKFIPEPVLTVIGSEPVLGEPVKRNVSGTANMLSVALKICGAMLTSSSAELPVALGTPGDGATTTDRNADRDLWTKVCGYRNPRPVLGVSVTLQPPNSLDGSLSPPGYEGFRMFVRSDRTTGASTYPGAAPVLQSSIDPSTGIVALDPKSKPVVEGLSDAVEMPVCYIRPVGKEDLITLYTQAGELPANLPWCPDELLGTRDHDMTLDEQVAWVQRGAANAGFMVYAYADALSRGEVAPKAPYDQCELLEPAMQSMP